MSTSSAVIQNIDVLCNTGSPYMAYFFFDFKDAGKQDARALLSSFLVQLSEQSDSHCDKLLALYSSNRCVSELPKLTNEALTRCLKEMLMMLGQVPVYLIIDGVDECPDTCGIRSSRREVLDLVKGLVELHIPNLRLFATSRPENDIRAVLEHVTCTSISIHDQEGQKRDIFDYINYVIDSEIDTKRWREEDKELVIRTLSERAGGM
jgi:NACHT domain